MNCPHRRRVRSGFTMVELLVVIAVIGVLVALLVPAVTGAVRRARDAQVAAEIQMLAQSLQSFKTKYGDFPPSAMWLCEDGDYTLSTLGTRVGHPLNAHETRVAQSSIRYLRKFFPRVAIVTTNTSGAATGLFYNFNGNYDIVNKQQVPHQDATPFYIEGHECLVFFLGGIPTPSQPFPNPGGAFVGMGGFSNNPTNPFVGELAQPSPRSRPLFDFRADRLVDTDGDGDGMPSYLDSLGTGSEGRPYAYLSSYGGNNYDPDDENALSKTVSPDDNGTGQHFIFSASNAGDSPAPNPYTSGPPNPSSGGVRFLNAESYQIFSAGRDRMYGVGGQYLPSTNGNRLPLSNAETPTNPNIRDRERDNIANFSNGTLE